MPGWRLLAIQGILLLILTIVFRLFDWDRSIAEIFYQTGGQGWYLGKQPLWVWLHAYGTIPGVILTLLALSVWIAGFYIRQLSPWRRPCLVVVLTTILAAGLLVNAVLKQYWGRPRPDQTIAFGGQWEYRPIFPPGTPGKGASFPCGHCTMGFVFLAMAGFRRRSKMLAFSGVATGILLGGLLSACRVVQGAHFVSDTIWSLGIVGMTATALGAYLPDRKSKAPDKSAEPMPSARKVLITIAAIIVMVAVAGGFLTRRPFYRTMVYPLDFSSPIEVVQININGAPESVSVRYAPEKDGCMEVNAHGFGWVEFDYQMGHATRLEGKTLKITLRIEARSYFAELDHSLALTLPQKAKDRVKVMVNNKAVGKEPPL